MALACGWRRSQAAILAVMRVVWIIIVCLTATLVVAQTKPRQGAPDVFLITIDTLRADHVHCYGYSGVKTPMLDSLAAEGIRFSEAFTSSPITNSSHTTILTGLLPSNHGVTDFAVPLAESHPTMAELLKLRGYHTAAFIGAVILDSNTLAPGLDRGFDFYDNFPTNAKSGSHWDRLERRGEVVAQHANNWLIAHPNGPRFVWVHLYDPHDPYEPPAPYSQTYKNNLYDGEIAYADSALAKFICFLKNRGWYDNALVVVVGDHGEGLGEHKEETHGIFLYDSTTHVPLIMKLPAGKQAGKVVDAQVRTTDILPTVLGVVGETEPATLDGQSLGPYLTGRESESRIAIGETDYPLRFGWAALRSVRAEGMKFIEAPRPELYDLRADPKELQNSYSEGNESVKKLREVLASIPRSAPPTPSDADQDKLQALGYAGQASAAKGALPDPKDKIEEQNLLHHAMMAAQDNRFAEARQALEQVLQRDEKSFLALRQLGEVNVRSGDYAQARQHLKQAQAINPDDTAVAFLLGQALQKTRDLEGARAVLEASLKTNPNEPQARLLLGQVYLDAEKTDEAADQFEALLLIQPTNLEAQLGLAKAKIASKKFAEAASVLEDLIKAQPKNADAFELLVNAYRGLGKTAEAARAEARARLFRKK